MTLELITRLVPSVPMAGVPFAAGRSVRADTCPDTGSVNPLTSTGRLV